MARLFRRFTRRHQPLALLNGAASAVKTRLQELFHFHDLRDTQIEFLELALSQFLPTCRGDGAPGESAEEGPRLRDRKSRIPRYLNDSDAAHHSRLVLPPLGRSCRGRQKSCPLVVAQRRGSESGAPRDFAYEHDSFQ